MKLLDRIDPRTRASADALGFYAEPRDAAEARELDEREARTYWWFSPEALAEDAHTTAARAADHASGRLRALRPETRYLWSFSVREAEVMRREAEAFSAIMRGMFRHRLATLGFTDRPTVEEALQAFLKGRQVDVNYKLNAPSQLLVDGKVVAHNVVATHLRVTPLAPEV